MLIYSYRTKQNEIMKNLSKVLAILFLTTLFTACSEESEPFIDGNEVVYGFTYDSVPLAGSKALNDTTILSSKSMPEIMFERSGDGYEVAVSSADFDLYNLVIYGSYGIQKKVLTRVDFLGRDQYLIVSDDLKWIE